MAPGAMDHGRGPPQRNGDAPAGAQPQTSGRQRAARLDLRLIVITDRTAARGRHLLDILTRCLKAGAPAIQVRDKSATARELLQLTIAIRALPAPHPFLLFVNDRIDVALAAGADGAHLGSDDIPLPAARAAAPPPFLLGWSTDDADVAKAAETAGADYIGCGAVFGTSNKAEAGTERIGPARLAEVVRAVRIPVVGIGGITPGNVRDVASTGAAGVAVIGSVMGADDVGDAVTRLLDTF